MDWITYAINCPSRQHDYSGVAYCDIKVASRSRDQDQLCRDESDCTPWHFLKCANLCQEK